MADFHGTTGLDVFVGPSNTVNRYYFEAGELTNTDIIVGAGGGDYIHFLDGEFSGTSGTVLFLNVQAVDRLYFESGCKHHHSQCAGGERRQYRFLSVHLPWKRRRRYL